MPRPARPDDLYRLAVPFDPRLSPDGQPVVFTVKRTPVGQRRLPATRSGSAPTDGATPARQLTIGSGRTVDRASRPDGRTLAFISDRRLLRRGGARPAEGGQGPRRLRPAVPAAARRRRGAPPDRPAARRDRRSHGRPTAAARRPDRARAARRWPRTRRRAVGRRSPKPGETPLSDYRYIDRLAYQYNGIGFIDDHDAHLWLVDVATGEARPLVAGPTAEGSPPGRPTAPASRSPRTGAGTRTSRSGSSICVVDVASGEVTLDRRRRRHALRRARPGRATAPRSSRSATSCRAAATGPGSGAFAADGSDAARAAARTCSPRAS